MKADASIDCFRVNRDQRTRSTCNITDCRRAEPGARRDGMVCPVSRALGILMTVRDTWSDIFTSLLVVL
jgi:hypothetical protein